MGVIPITSMTTSMIKSFSTDKEKSNALLALLDYYHKDSLINISEEQALVFLENLGRAV